LGGRGRVRLPERSTLTGSGTRYLKSEIARWGKVIRDNDIHVNQ
jgi:hypothetical protein